MAKGKHATALFEVIHSAKRPPQGSPAAKMAVPRSWWKSKGKPIDEEIPGQAARPSRLALMSALISPSRAQKLVPEQSWSDPAAHPTPTSPPAPCGYEPEPFTPAPTIPQPTEPFPFEAVEPVAFDPAFHDFEPSSHSYPASDPTPARGAHANLNGEINFRLSYGGAIAAGMILLLLVAIAYLAGTRMSEVGSNSDATTPPAPAQADAASPAAAGSVSATAKPQASGMLAAVTETPAASTDTSAPTPPSAAPAATTTRQLISPDPVASPALLTAEPVRRQIGRTYVVVQCYPDADVAAKASDFLARHGIASTVVRGLPRWTLRSWYTVVGCRPFDHPRQNPALDAYMNRLTELGEDFAGQTTFNKFDPNPYTWKADADAIVSGR